VEERKTRRTGEGLDEADVELAGWGRGDGARHVD